LSNGPVTTIQGEDISVAVDNGAVALTDALGLVSNVAVADVTASNGVAHVVDSVLLPSWLGTNANEWAANEGQFTIVMSLSERADLLDFSGSLGMGDGLTIFLPTNAAFEGIDTDSLTDDEVSSILANHVVAAVAPSGGLSDGMQVPSLANLNLKIGVTDTGVTVNGANVIRPDNLVNNGIVHVIDKVLLPGAEQPGDSCGDIFCKDGVTNGSFVLDADSGLTCDSLKPQLANLPADTETCEQALGGEAVCCPGAQECFLCGGKDVKLGKPDQIIPGDDENPDTTCAELDSSLSFIPKDQCDLTLASMMEGFNIQSFCGCEGVEVPNVCDPLCAADQTLNKDGVVPGTEFSCEFGENYAKQVTEKEICESDVNIKNNTDACCIDGDSNDASIDGSGGGDKSDDSGAVSSFSVAAVAAIAFTNLVHVF